MRERVALAISLVRESVKALLAMPWLIFFPLFECVVFVFFTTLWLVYSLYLMSSGTVSTVVDGSTGDSYKVLNYNNHTSLVLVFEFFCWIWCIRFVEALGQLTSAHAVLTWYFAEDRKSIPSNQVFISAALCLRYHSGTAAFGSFVLALLEFVRSIVEYVRSKLLNRASCLARLIGCILSCILCLFDRCLRYLTTNAFIQCALVGTPFCSSAIRAFGLILRNLGRVSTVLSVAGLVMFIGKISVSLTAGSICYLYLNQYKKNQISGSVLPSVLVAYLSYRIASLFLNVVSITSNTILQAFIIEEEMHGGLTVGISSTQGDARHDTSTLKECVAALKDASTVDSLDEVALVDDQEGFQMTILHRNASDNDDAFVVNDDPSGNSALREANTSSEVLNALNGLTAASSASSASSASASMDNIKMSLNTIDRPLKPPKRISPADGNTSTSFPTAQISKAPRKFEWD